MPRLRRDVLPWRGRPDRCGVLLAALLGAGTQAEAAAEGEDMNETDLQDGTLGRRLSVSAFGDNPEEIEFAALDEARRFFGEEAVLAIQPSYRVWVVETRADKARANGKRYWADISVGERVPGR